MLTGFIYDPGEIRTHDPQFRRLLLYPAELPDHLVCPQQNINYYRETLIKMQEDFSKKFLFFQIQLKYN